MRKVLTFDDVALVPQYNNIESRTEPNLSTWLTKELRMDIPILASNMDSVIGLDLAKILIERGSIPILHRFYKNPKEVRDIVDFLDGKCFLSVGLNAAKEYKFICELNKSPLGVVIDVAHGHGRETMNTIAYYKNSTRIGLEGQVIAGNVCTKEGYIDLVNSGADAVKVGIGPGAACTTRTVTGFGVSQFSAIRDCARQARKYKVPIIADGGIRNSGDIVKALAAGASSVMIGKMFACTKESAAKKNWSYDACNERYVANYRGQASRAFQEDFFGEVKAGTVPEGEDMWAPVTGSANDLLDQLLGGIRSGMTYGGARDIKELQRKAEFVKVTNNHQVESNTRQ